MSTRRSCSLPYRLVCLWSLSVEPLVIATKTPQPSSARYSAVLKEGWPLIRVSDLHGNARNTVLRRNWSWDPRKASCDIITLPILLRRGGLVGRASDSRSKDRRFETRLHQEHKSSEFGGLWKHEKTQHALEILQKLARTVFFHCHRFFSVKLILILKYAVGNCGHKV